jgi:hypothetical protein
MTSAEAEEGQDRQNHDNQTDKIDKTVHDFLRMSRRHFSSDNPPESAKFLVRTGKSSKP